MHGSQAASHHILPGPPHDSVQADLTMSSPRLRRQTCIRRARTSEACHTAAHVYAPLADSRRKQVAISLFLCRKKHTKRAGCEQETRHKTRFVFARNRFLLFFQDGNGGQPCSLPPTSMRWFSCTWEKTEAGRRFPLRGRRYSKERVGGKQG